MWKKWLAISAVVLLLTVGCSKKETVVEENEEPNQEVQEDPKQEEKELAFHYPLTGVGSEEEVEGRAVAVMVNNDPAARQQSGLHRADIIYEILAEGNVTRFLAIYQSEKPEIIGPVRSARDYYIELAKGYDSLYIAHGNSESARKLLDKGYIDNLNGLYYDGTLFKRVNFRKAPHNSYITFDNILKGAKQNDYDMEQEPDSLTFLTDDEMKNLSGENAQKISISYYDEIFSSTLEFNESTGKYTRFSNGEQTVDYDSKEPVLIDNLFIIETDHKILNDVGHRDIDLTSGGSAYLFQNGKMISVQWKNDDGKILPYLNGKPVGFVPGKTWINVIPTNSGLDSAVSFE